MLPIFAALLALVAVLNFRPAPDFVWAWILALAVSEYGHWLVLLPLGLGILAVETLHGPALGVTVILCAWSIGALLRPAFQAWRLGRTFGEGVFSFRRLYFRRAPRRANVIMHTFASVDGEELKLDFYPPTNPAGRSMPCVVIIHGGGWDQGTREQIPEWNHRLAARGYAVAAIDYRLAPKWHWPAPREDVLGAITWLKAHAMELGVDPHKLVLLGRSAGGQIATAAGYGADDPDIAGVIAFYAPHDMRFAWSVSRDDDALGSLRLMRQYFGVPLDAKKIETVRLYQSGSGQWLAKKSSPRTLLIHGVPDTLVWHRHSVRLSGHLSHLGVKHHFLSLPWATHAFDFNADGPGGQLADYAMREFLIEVTR
ncbi:MAG TPA: alpha/beta hydrolase [Candidatus Didemnitutus sp.]|nr:alpha/beta hydrolase [Candidatus Didemnitutus sp.]